MKKRLLFLLVPLFFAGCSASRTPLYKNPEAPVEKRVRDLLNRMTLEEKVAQLRHLHSWDLQVDSLYDTTKMRAMMGEVAWGSIEGLTLPGRSLAENMERAQRYCVEQTRLGIPMFTITESLHGLSNEGATIFPQAIALGSTFEPELAYRMARQIAEEARAAGINQVLSPVVDVIRELRWGRVEESFGEDPFQVSQFGLAEVNGYLEGEVAPMLKVIGPHGVPTAGLNLASTEASERDLREVYLKPYEVIVKNSDIRAVMTAYNSTNRIPNTANSFLLNDILREEWGFKGYVYSDWASVSMLHQFHRVAATPEDAVRMALEAGTEVEASSHYYELIPSMVKSGELDQQVVDRACARVLYAKFKGGLFEHPYGYPTQEFAQRVHTPQAVALAREIARESAILMKNDGALLPLDENKIRSLAVIGPNADQVQFGDYTWSRNNQHGTTPLEGIRRLVGDKIAIHYASGCDLVSQDRSGISAAVAAARRSDVAVVFVGSASASLARDYKNSTCGEGYDLTDLNLTGMQGELVRAVQQTGKPVVLVLVAGRPFSIAWEKANIPAILIQWYGGECEGEVAAELLFGRVNPSGRLNYSFPQSVGHLPVFYNHLPSDRGYYHQSGSAEHPGRDYVFSSPDPLWAYGHGLSYTSFDYKGVTFNKRLFDQQDTLRVKVRVANSGDRDGKEVVQLYVRDLAGSVVMPVKQLKGFSKVAIAAGSEKEVEIAVPISELGLYNLHMKYVVEPGLFDVMIGKASDDICFIETIEVRDPKRKCSLLEADSLARKNSATQAYSYSGNKMNVHGIVRDVQATAVEGAMVQLAGTSQSTFTNVIGEYSIEVPSDGILVFTKRGFGRHEEPVKGDETVHATLHQQTE